MSRESARGGSTGTPRARSEAPCRRSCKYLQIPCKRTGPRRDPIEEAVYGNEDLGPLPEARLADQAPIQSARRLADEQRHQCARVSHPGCTRSEVWPNSKNASESLGDEREALSGGTARRDGVGVEPSCCSRG